MNNGTLPPHHADHEAAALACVFDCDSPDQLFDALSLELFYDERHRNIFTATQEFRADYEISLVNLVEWAKRKNLIERCGGLHYLEHLPEAKISVHNWTSYLESLKAFSIRRSAGRDGAALAVVANDLTRSVREVSDTARAIISSYAARDASEAPVIATSLGDFQPPPDNDPDELLKHRFLCRRGALLLTGPTGVGKSSFIMQALVLWANGLPFLGITPTQPLTSVLIQAENDDGDLAEMRNGVCTGLNLTEDQRREAFHRVLVHSSTGVTGRKFCEEVVAPLLDRHRPDLLPIDPALSFMGGDVKEQKDVGAFLRQHLNPQLYAHNCACLMVHHTNKPKSGRDDTSPLNGDWAYQGSGSAEWANWARAVISLQSSGEPGVYKLHAGKRGARIGWRDENDQTLFEKVIVHSREKGLICWHESDPSSLPDRGRPKAWSDKELLSLLDTHSLSTEDWQASAKKEFGISESTFHRARRDLATRELVLKSHINSKWQKVSKTL